MNICIQCWSQFHQARKNIGANRFRCPECGTKNIIPTGSPRGQALMKKAHKHLVDLGISGSGVHSIHGTGRYKYVGDVFHGVEIARHDGPSLIDIDGSEKYMIGNRMVFVFANGNVNEKNGVVTLANGARTVRTTG